MPDNHTGYLISVVDEDPLRARKDARELLTALGAVDPTARLDLPEPGSLMGIGDKGGPSAETVGLLLVVPVAPLSSSPPLFSLSATTRPTTATSDTAMDPMITGLLPLPPPCGPWTAVGAVPEYGGGVAWPCCPNATGGVW